MTTFHTYHAFAMSTASQSFTSWLRRVASRKTAPLLEGPRTMRDVALAAQVADETKQIAFTFSVIALASQLVREQGELTSPRYLAFRQAFPMQASEDVKLRTLFDLASREGLPAQHYVRQIMRLFPAKPQLYRDVLARMLKIAAVKSSLSVADYNYLNHMARQFGLSQREFRQMVAPFGAPKASDPYAVLGLRKSCSLSAVKAAHTRLMKQYHPDRFQAEGASQEMIALLTERVAEINAAYSAVLKQRKSQPRWRG